MSDLEPVLEAVTQERREHEIHLACEAEGHAWARDGADPIHGVCGLCACGSALYTLTGELIEP
jgi:hypothetical protein